MKLHIFPRGGMCSIQHALMVWLVPMFLVVGASFGALSWWTHGRMVNSFLDDQMEQLGQSLAQHGMPRLPQLDEDRVFKWGSYVVQGFGPNGLEATSWQPLTLAPQSPGFHDAEHDGRSWRVYTVPATTASGQVVQVVQSSSFRTKLAAERAGTALLPVLILLPLSLLAMWAVVRAIGRAVQDIAQQAQRQDEHSIAELPLERVPQEIVPLVESFNALLRRLRDAFATQRRFVQDAAHELRTPVTAIGLQLENLRSDIACGGEERFAQLEAGVRRAQRLIDQLLRLSRQEAQGADGPATVDLQAQVRESICTLITLADQRNIDLGLDGPQGSLPVRCVPGDLRSLLDNLIENALRYTPEGGLVDVRLLCEGDRVAFEVVDTGPGIPEEFLPRVFDRFFRVPGSGPTGSGLGLSIAQAAAQRCGLAITLRNREDRSGLIARVEAQAA